MVTDSMVHVSRWAMKYEACPNREGECELIEAVLRDRLKVGGWGSFWAERLFMHQRHLCLEPRQGHS